MNKFKIDIDQSYTDKYKYTYKIYRSTPIEIKVWFKSKIVWTEYSFLCTFFDLDEARAFVEEAKNFPEYH